MQKVHLWMEISVGCPNRGRRSLTKMDRLRNVRSSVWTLQQILSDTLYSGGTPEFIEGDVFRTIIPLDAVSVGKVGPSHTLTVIPQDNQQTSLSEKILLYCHTPHSKKEIAAYCGYKDVKNFASRYLKPLLDNGSLKMTLPDKPSSKNQKYVTVQIQKKPF